MYVAYYLDEITDKAYTVRNIRDTLGWWNLERFGQNQHLLCAIKALYELDKV